MITGREVKNLEDALDILKGLGVVWVSTNNIENNLWTKGVAFFDKSYCRVAYYDETNSELSVNGVTHVNHYDGRPFSYYRD